VDLGPNYKNLPGGHAPVHPPQGNAFGSRYALAAYSWSFAAYSDSHRKPCSVFSLEYLNIAISFHAEKLISIVLPTSSGERVLASPKDVVPFQ